MRRLFVLALLGAACSAPSAGLDSGPADAGHDDAARIDAGHADAGVDGGTGGDAGTDGGADGGPLDDAGIDADLDGGTDASADGGSDADLDAGPSDSGIARTIDPPTHPSATPIAPFAECTVTTATDTIGGADHRTPCEVIPYPAYPPSAGPHYGIWASFLTYASPVPWGFLVHDLEHGALVLAYHCENDADCDPVRAEYASIIADHGVDPVCRMETTPTRFIVVPDPMLPVPIAAVAWQHVYEATCLDPASLRAFVDAHYGIAPEALCVGNLDGTMDGGWCP